MLDARSLCALAAPLTQKELSMRIRSSSLAFSLAAIFVLTVLGRATPSAAQTERILHSFGASSKDGWGPGANLISDSSGNLYGTTAYGGGDNVGTVFEWLAKPGGIWTEVELHSFVKDGRDGQNPLAGLVFDSAGNLYGTTNAGGVDGGGIVFELSPPIPPSTRWVEKVLHTFLANNKDGLYPSASLLFDSAGNLYGTTGGGGDRAAGTAFELSPTTGGSWTEAVLHSFAPSTKGLGDGKNPRTALIGDPAGNLYGTTSEGGSLGNGTVFELTPSTGGSWIETILYSFANGGGDGAYPLGRLIFDSDGNLYGTTSQGGPNGGGTLYKLTPSPDGWAETVLYFFAPVYPSTDGNYPVGNLVFDSSGNLYGTTAEGGIGDCFGLGPVCGIVYELTPSTGAWTETVLHYFDENGTDGYYPLAGLFLGEGGIFYGTTELGGTSSSGTLFAIKP